MKFLQNIFAWVRFFGIQQVPRIIWNSLTRARQNLRFTFGSLRQKRTQCKNPGNLISVEATINGARCRFENAAQYIDFLAADMVRIYWEPGQNPYPYAIDKNEWSKVQCSLTESEGDWLITSLNIKIWIGSDGSLRFDNTNGQSIRQEEAPEMFGEPKNPGWISNIRMRPEECLYGLGEQAGPFNLRGTRHRIWNTDPRGGYGPGVDPIYMPLPVYMSLHEDGSYLIFYENSFPAIFDFSSQSGDQPETCKITFECGSLRYYFISGHPSDTLRRFTQLTGRPELPPKWSLGYHHSRWGYRTEKEIRSLAAGFAIHDLPVSAIHLDIDHMKGYRTFTVDENRFPDLVGLANELDLQGIKLISIVNPGVKIDSEYPIFNDGLRNNHFLTDRQGKLVKGVVWPGWSVFPDFTDSKTRKWWKDQYQILIRSNIAGIWHDMNEPTSFSLYSDMDLPSNTTYKLEGSGGDHRQAHNLFGLLMNQSGFGALSEARPSRRPWLLSRSGWVSQQRYAWNWTGDVESSWESLRMTIATVLGLGLSGIPYCGSDIGGFNGNPSAELFLRWFQMAAFLPFFRTHSSISAARREPWIFGEPYTGIIRNYLKFRYQLMPYLYSLAWQTAQTGLPFLRPLFWLDMEDRNLWEIDDSFLLGDHLLLAPVLKPNETWRRIYLPKGKWTSWWDGSQYQGPGTAEIKVTLDNIPLLVKSGSVIPLEEAGSLYLHIFPPESDAQSSPLILYNDSGEGYGDSRLDRFQIERLSNRIIITRTGEGEFPIPYNKIYIKIHSILGISYLIDNQETSLQNNFLETNIFERIEIET